MWFWWFYSLLPDFPSFSIRPQWAGLFDNKNKGQGRNFGNHRHQHRDPFSHIFSDIFDEIVNGIELSNRIFGT